MYIFFKERDYIFIELPRRENPTNPYARHTETLDNCFDLIRSHQQCIRWSPTLDIEQATTDCKAKIMKLSHQSISLRGDAKLTSYGNCVAN